ncbi:L-aspartate oxidase [Pelagibius sp. Alg239-R121]|uniref:L-aspartate oxidase n=1 Tax=Pelagibius sp. Alg239-R121 TaxID=2993448 RepID=UPI0024A6AB02|nr:L-aspartate oxidase [Pelagibius sp. Alg239-R121]
MIKGPHITRIETPVVIVGSGAAGLACALALAPTPVTVLTKTPQAASGSSPLAQGGIAAALGAGDSAERHGEDTLAAGAGLSDRDRVRHLVWEGIPAVKDLIARGFPADRDANHRLKLGREAAHSLPRILHADGDSTGRALVETLLAQVTCCPSITIATSALAIDLLCEDSRVTGLLTYQKDQGWIRYRTRAVVLASGGSGALWLETTNAAGATGDGLALASRAGAELSDLEFMQFHPTALLPKDRNGGQRLDLMTEALRGAGARLLDDAGVPFMTAEHPLVDLAPRDVVARAIGRRRLQGQNITLDLRPALDSAGENAFPQCLALCRAAGYEPTRTPVPVAPAAHYHMGGIRTDADGRSSVSGLWACGEAAATGVHGANRLASNSLLESLVFARRVAAALRSDGEAVAERSGGETVAEAAVPDIPLPKMPTGQVNKLADLTHQIRSAMSRHAGLVRDPQGLSKAVTKLGRLQTEFNSLQCTVSNSRQPGFDDLQRWSELRNSLLAARLILQTALRREESRGAHFRADLPAPNPVWAHHQILTLTDLI